LPACKGDSHLFYQIAIKPTVFALAYIKVDPAFSLLTLSERPLSCNVRLNLNTMKETPRLPDVHILRHLYPHLFKKGEVLLVPVVADLPRDHQTYHFKLLAPSSQQEDENEAA